MRAAVPGTAQRCRPGARQDHVRVERVDGQSPDGERVHGRVQSLPVLASIRTAVYAAVRATVENTRVCGMHRQGAHGTFAIEARAHPHPGGATIAAAPDALSKRAYTDRSMLCHCLSPFNAPRLGPHHPGVGPLHTVGPPLPSPIYARGSVMSPPRAIAPSPRGDAAAKMCFILPTHTCIMPSCVASSLPGQPLASPLLPPACPTARVPSATLCACLP
jgi:hypothetical protein